jgi:hypothetical protein
MDNFPFRLRATSITPLSIKTESGGPIGPHCRVPIVSLKCPIILVYTQHQLRSRSPSLQTVWLVSIAISIAGAVSVAVAAITAATAAAVSSAAFYSH